MTYPHMNYEDLDITDIIGEVSLSHFLRNEIPTNSITNNSNKMTYLKLDWRGVLTAAVISVLTGIAGYLSTVGGLTNFDWKALGFVALSAFIGTLAQQLGTSTETSRFAGAIPVK